MPQASVNSQPPNLLTFFILPPNAVPRRINNSPIQDIPVIRKPIILVHNTVQPPITVPNQQLIIHKQRNTIADRTDTVSHFKTISTKFPILTAQPQNSLRFRTHSPSEKNIPISFSHLFYSPIKTK